MIVATLTWMSYEFEDVGPELSRIVRDLAVAITGEYVGRSEGCPDARIADSEELVGANDSTTCSTNDSGAVGG